MQDRIPLWPNGAPANAPDTDFEPYIRPMLLDVDAPRGLVIVCPGGGYSMRAGHEGAVIGEAINTHGYHAVILQYRTFPCRHPAPLLDASRAIRLVRSHAAEWEVDPDRIAITGFSAGGHLAGSLAILHDRCDFAAEDDLPHISNRPDAAILSYAVISSGECAHSGSFKNLLGDDYETRKKEFSLELQVNDKTAPIFLWHTTDDPAVPAENSILLARSLAREGIPYELHLFPGDRHGVGLSHDDPHVANWMMLAMEWLDHRFGTD